MAMILWKKCGLRIADCYFDDGIGAATGVGADLIRYYQWTHPVAGCQGTPFWTSVIDLRLSPQRIFEQMTPDTRKEIRRAESKDALAYCYSEHSNSALLSETFDLHDKFTALKGLPKTNRTRLWAFWQAGSLDISLIRDPAGSPLAWRIYYRNPHRVRALHTGSLHRAASESTQRNLIGRANRYAVWRDILRFKDSGLEAYDFGGWYTGNNDVHKLKINSFKKEFGGSIEKSFNCGQSVTLRGKLILALVEVRAHWMSIRNSDVRVSEAGV
jgi:hypothetical protein